jgi:hypothetical protein
MTDTTKTADAFNKVFFGSDNFSLIWTPVHWLAVGTTAVLAWPKVKKMINKASAPSATPTSARAKQRVQTQAPRRSVDEGVVYND